MWSRRQLKEKAKISLKQNYWKVVLVCALLVMLGTGGGASYSLNLQEDEDIEELTHKLLALGEEDADEDTFSEAEGMQYSEQYYYEDNSDMYWTGYYDGYFGLEKESTSLDYLDGYNDGILDDYVEAGYDPYAEPEAESEEWDSTDTAAVVIVVILAFFIVLIVAMAIALPISAFIGNPLDLGARKFLVKNLNEKAEVKEVAYAFDSNYKNIVKILFLRDLYLVLWYMLFIIPGVVKTYEYFMVPYLLIENPNLTKEEAFAISKQMMKGQKWRTFILNLSFFGWDLLSACTMGILNIFYVAPYRNLTFAALFEELNAAHGYPARYVHRSYEQPYQNMSPYTQSEDIAEYRTEE